ncbi:hypothetical protein P0L94_02970 [Microbacter sp. GSS18]|nr:hypothetical protein P0L94_02970 [Microbacter sp. GSS18]
MSESDALRLGVDLPNGRAEVSAAFEPAEDAWATLAIAHGAGAGFDHAFMVGFARGMRSAGVSTLRFNFPYVESGRRMPGPAAHAMRTWAAAAEAAAGLSPEPMWAAGKSYGGRMASMAAAEGLIEPRGLIYLGYPLHPPGKPEKPRLEHLPSVTPRQLFVEGTRDPFVDPHEQLIEAVAACQDASIAWIDGGGHSFEVAGRKRPADVVAEELAPLVADWMRAR